MRPRSLIASFGIAAGIGLLPAGPAGAQVSGSDPFRPYTRQYDDFVSPSAPTNPALPNASRYQRDLETGGAARRYQQSEEIGRALGLDQERDGYLYNDATGREDAPRYRAKQDQQFYMDQKERERLYFEASSERDPKKRAEKMKAYQEAVRKSARGADRSSTSRNSAKAGAKRGDLSSRFSRDIIDGTPRTSESAARNPSPAARKSASSGTKPASAGTRSTRATEFNPRRAGTPAGESRREADRERARPADEEPEAEAATSSSGRYGARSAEPEGGSGRSRSLLGTDSKKLSDRLRPTDLLYRSMDRSRRFRENTGTTPSARPESNP